MKHTTVTFVEKGLPPFGVAISIVVPCTRLPRVDYTEHMHAVQYSNHGHGYMVALRTLLHIIIT
jgi:hypothetical protein